MAKKDNSTLLWLVLIGLVIFGISGGQLSNLFQAEPGAITEGEQEPTETPSQAGIQRTITVETVTFALHPYDVFSPGATIDIEGVVMKGNDVKFDSDALATETVALTPLGTYTIYMWNDGQTTDLSGSSISLSSSKYYGYQATITMPFSGEATFPGDFDTDYVGNYKASAPSSYIKNPNGTVNSSSNQQDLGSGDVKTFILHYDAPNNAAYGAPEAAKYGAYLQLACDYNVDLYNSVEMTSAIYDGKTYDVREATNYPDYNTTIFDWVGEIVGLSGIVDNKALEIGLTVEVANVEPVDATADITCYLLDPQLWYDSTNGTGFHWGVDDSEANTDVGQSNHYLKIYVN
ncbi:MAG: hypothetical protein ACTSV7_14905 [Candidatus Baldrarchaeia archaeon]